MTDSPNSVAEEINPRRGTLLHAFPLVLLLLSIAGPGEAAPTPVISGVASNLNVVTWADSQWIAAGKGGKILASSDASTWKIDSSVTTADLVGLASSGSSVVAIGTQTWSGEVSISGQFTLSSSISSGVALRSTDGKSWSKTAFGDTIPSTVVFGTSQGDPLTPTAIFWSGSRYVLFTQPYSGNGTVETLVTPTAHPMRVSTDGASWRNVVFADSALNLQLAGWFGTYGLAIHGSSVYGALNDSEWSEIGTLPSNSTITGLAFSGAHYIAVGDFGGIFTSSDGQSWSTRTSGVLAGLNAVAHGSGWTVAVGDSGVIMVSQDDSTWTSIASGTTKALRGIAANDSLFVAVGDSGTILRIPIASLATAGVRSHVSASRVSMAIHGDQLAISLSTANNGARLSLQIVGLDGKVQQERQIAPTGTNLVLSLPHMPSGTYLLRLEGDGLRASQVFMVP